MSWIAEMEKKVRSGSGIEDILDPGTVDCMHDISNQIEVLSDDMLLDWLEPYGVTKHNYLEYVPRVLVEEMEDRREQHFFLDGKYVFSVKKVIEPVFGEAGKFTGFQFTYKQFLREKEV